jgi:hypothetical protein
MPTIPFHPLGITYNGLHGTPNPTAAQVSADLATTKQKEQKFYSQAATQFMFLKDAWRNHIMHVRDVPYDEGRAFSIFDHVRQFMQALAEGGLTE